MPSLFSLVVVMTIGFTTVTSLSFDNVTTNAIEDREGLVCVQPPNAVKNWRLMPKSDMTYSCLKHPKTNRYWSMLNAYRSGGKKFMHWKYATSTGNPDCLVGWTYYGKDGNWVVADVLGRVTRLGDKLGFLWCGLPVAQTKKKTNEPTGIEGKQWAYCNCTMQT